MTIQSIGPSAPARSADRQPADAIALQPARAPAAPVDTRVAVERSAPAPSPEQVAAAVKNINKSLATLSQDLEFSVDTDSNRTVVKVVDQKTKEVIRQMPSAEALEIAKALDTVQGLLIKQQA